MPKWKARGAGAGDGQGASRAPTGGGRLPATALILRLRFLKIRRASASPDAGCRGFGLAAPQAGERLQEGFGASLLAESSSRLLLADGFTAATNRPWTQPIGFIHALFEVAADVMKRADPTDSAAVISAIAATNLETIVGKVAWDGANVPPFATKNIAKTPLVGGQWRLKDGGGYDLVIVDNQTAPHIPTGGKMEAIA